MADNQLLKAIGKRVSARRQVLHLTQEQVAERMDVSAQMISNLELGKKAIRPENILKLCRVLDTSADYILSGYCSARDTEQFAKSFSRLSPKHQLIIGQLIESLIDDPDTLK